MGPKYFTSDIKSQDLETQLTFCTLEGARSRAAEDDAHGSLAPGTPCCLRAFDCVTELDEVNYSM